jgi:hypothetical protein
MKKFLILTAIVCSVVLSPVAHAEWTKVFKSVDGNIRYVDFERIKKHDGNAYYWELIDLLKPAQTGMISWLSYVEVECGRFRFRELTTTYYEGPMASGTISSRNNTPADWFYPKPDTLAERLTKRICKHKP